MSCLVVGEHRGGVLRNTTLELISAARDLGPATVLLIGPAAPSAVDAVDVPGVVEILLVDVEGDELDPETYRNVLSEVIRVRQPTVTLLAATAHSFAYGAAVAVTNGLGFAGDVQGLKRDGESIVATRSFYGGKVQAELDFPGRSGILLVVRPAVWPVATGAAGGARRTPISIDPPAPRTKRLEFVEEHVADVDITRADLILAVGRGIGERENLTLFEELAQKIGATLAASRPLVDAGWVSADRQVGQSGKTVKPSVYLAFGISGASQHLAGMRSSETVVAVNHDPNAAIFTIADYGGVFDAVELARELGKLY